MISSEGEMDAHVLFFATLFTQSVLCRSRHGALLLSEKTLDSLFKFGAEAQLLRALLGLRSLALHLSVANTSIHDAKRC